ncbi:MAG: 30S ribosome-binding factor RbfA [Defluviitaleaceae bacterium]|nr:30S ribosome-binding factor RbfA [Defluviitaleaceae bacterium]
MMNKRHRIDDEVKEQVALAIREIKDPRLSSLITVVAAEVSQDLKHAKIYVSILGSSEEEKSSNLEILKNSSGFLRTTISKRTSLRTAPQLHFFIDTSLDSAMKIENILKGL